MKSFLAAGAILALSLCARAEADFPQRLAGPQGQNWRPQVPTYGTQSYAVPNANVGPQAQNWRPQVPTYGMRPHAVPQANYPQSHSQAVPAYGRTGQATRPYQPVVPNMAPVWQTNRLPQNALMASAPGSHVIGSGVVNRPVLNSGPNNRAPVNAAVSSPAPILGGERNPYQQALSSSSWCCPPPVAKSCPTWFGGVYGLVMTREDEENFYLFTSDVDPSSLYCPSSDFETDYIGGIEARVGRTFCCGKWGLEFVYWGLNPNSESAIINTADVHGTMMSTIDYSLVWGDFGSALPITDVTDSITYANIWRREEYHNAEVNLLSGPLTLAASCCGCGDACGAGGCGLAGARGGYTPGYLGRGNRGCCGPRWVAHWVLGFRYFKFDEDIGIFMDRDDNIFDSTPNEINHDIGIENNLYGFQLGTDINYCLTDCLHLDFGSKFGIYGNHATQDQQISTPQGPAYVLPGTPEDFSVQSQEDDVAFLGELRAGFGYRIGCHFRFTGGYRAIAASGVATALGQINHGRTLGSLWNVADIDTDDSLVLHGAYVGTEFAW